MRKEKALLLVLKIVDTCKKYGNEERCTDCPFNIGGCVFEGEIPTDWHLSELPYIIEQYRKKERINNESTP